MRPQWLVYQMPAAAGSGGERTGRGGGNPGAAQAIDVRLVASVQRQNKGGGGGGGGGKRVGGWWGQVVVVGGWWSACCSVRSECCVHLSRLEGEILNSEGQTCLPAEPWSRECLFCPLCLANTTFGVRDIVIHVFGLQDEYRMP